MQNELKTAPKQIKILKPKKILIKKGQERKVFESLDIPYPLLLKKDNQNNCSSGNIN